MKHVKTAAIALAGLLAAGCVADDFDSGPQQDLQLAVPGGETATVTIHNPYSFTIGVVSFQDCNTRAYAEPHPQVIEPGANATYVVAPRCYVVVAGEAGLSFKHAIEPTQINVSAGDEIRLP